MQEKIAFLKIGARHWALLETSLLAQSVTIIYIHKELFLSGKIEIWKSLTKRATVSYHIAGACVCPRLTGVVPSMSKARGAFPSCSPYSQYRFPRRREAAKDRANLLHLQLVKKVWKLKGSISIDRERCKGCTLCIEFRPKKAISISDDLNLKGYYVAVFDNSKGCTGCATCAVICPDVAIEVEKNWNG